MRRTCLSLEILMYLVEWKGWVQEEYGKRSSRSRY